MAAGSKKTPRTSPAQKRAQIIEAARDEFIARGFEAASTNAIATRAQVAKGLVFHHFGSKEALYLAVFQHVAEAFQQAIAAGLDPAPPTDLFDRMNHWAEVKLRVMRRHPAGYRFFVQAASQPPEPLREAVQERLAAIAQASMEPFLDGLDFTRLRPGVTPEQAMNVFMLLREGMERRYLPRLLAADMNADEVQALSDESLALFALLRDGVYRRE